MEYYRDYSSLLAELFPGRKMQKLTVNAGFSCPNRDGTIGRGGCAYCNNRSFSPALASTGGITAQLEAGKRFFARKYPAMRYLAYFQSYTNTHGDHGRLLALYREALSVEGVDGLIIGTRPDCVPQSLLEEIAGLQAPVLLEYGAESSHDQTLKRVNRCHTWAQTVDAVRRSAALGFHTGLHFIMGLPGDTREMMLETVRKACALPVSSLKFHQLQLIKDTPLERERPTDMTLFQVDDYLDLCVDIIDIVNSEAPGTAIERFTSSAPADMLVAPRWGLKNYQFTNLLKNRLAARQAH
ncbi:MAG: TIGR01212 family radical SAM protein [Muribaculaceae bacterium]|nr:TIGR01212 family radical SAM protein [Muribaculaceae bacterium]MDE7141938.1 TIGR01212 family radical SAM protein [Muribaculaceae bacterium]